MEQVFISVGTSLLTNLATHYFDSIRAITQESDESSLNENQRASLNKVIDDILKRTRNESAITNISAELSTLKKANLLKPKNLFYLILTDTVLGTLVGEVLKEILKKRLGIYNIQTIQPKGLNTKSQAQFQLATSEMAHNIIEHLGELFNPEYVIFVLSGGFKSVVSFLTVFATVNGIKSLFTFDSDNSELITIPYLPIEVSRNFVTSQLSEFLLLNQGPIPTQSAHKDISPFILINNNEATLNAWGKLLLNKMLSENNSTLPEFHNLAYQESFIDRFKKLKEVQKRIKLIKVVSKVSYLYNKSKLQGLMADHGLQFEFYTNTSIGHFRLNDGDRISCEINDKKIVLRKFGQHDEVNNNP